MVVSKNTNHAPPRVGVGVFVFRSLEDRRFLLGSRKGSIGSGTWSLAGGHLEYGETFAECASREVLEETGLEIERVEYLTTVESVFTAEDKHYVTIFMTGFVKKNNNGEISEPQTLEPDKCEGWYWHSFEEMREMSKTKELFLPITNLLVQRPDICNGLENEEVT